MNKAGISSFLRKTKLLYYTDYIRFLTQKISNYPDNRKFKQENPDVKLPPDYLIYESFQMSYRKYYSDSLDTAKWLRDYFKKYHSLENIKLLDWGCGPGRIIRHLPSLLINAEIYGTDYNKESIAWCKKNLPGIHFNVNTIDAVLPYQNNFFDVIYGISIFTHL